MSESRKVRLIAITEWLDSEHKVTSFKYVDDETGKQVERPADNANLILDPSVFEH